MGPVRRGGAGWERGGSGTPGHTARLAALRPPQFPLPPKGKARPTFRVNSHTAGTHRGLAATFTSKSWIFFPRKLKPEHFQPNPLFINLISVLHGNSTRELWIYPHAFSSYGLPDQAGPLEHAQLVSQKTLLPLGSPRVPRQKKPTSVPGEWRLLEGPGSPRAQGAEACPCHRPHPTLHPRLAPPSTRRTAYHSVHKEHLGLPLAEGWRWVWMCLEASGRGLPGPLPDSRAQEKAGELCPAPRPC